MIISKIRIILFIIVSSLIAFSPLKAQMSREDSISKSKELLQEANVQAAQKEIEITVRSVDISHFPEVKIFIEAYNKLGEPLDTLLAENLYVYENSVQKKVTSVERVPVNEQIAVDFIFVIDITGSMQKFINAVMRNISGFTTNLVRRGIDYRMGLVLFSDDINKIHQPTKSLVDFLSWLDQVQAHGGGDEKENALEALEAASKSINYRPNANKVVVLITDAPYHQKGEDEGFGVTNQTTQSIVEELQSTDVRVFSIAPPRVEAYSYISKKTRGTFFDIDYPFATILDNFSKQLTNLYYVKYLSEHSAIPDSIEIALFNPKDGRLIRRTIPIVELGRKLIIENLLFGTDSWELPEKVRELDILGEFLKNKDTINIMIEGHTDNIGTNPHNDMLSSKRADAVKQYLVKHGIRETRIKTVGYGKRRPIASNKDEFGRRLNRRTEIVILSK